MRILCDVDAECAAQFVNNANLSDEISAHIFPFLAFCVPRRFFGQVEHGADKAQRIGTRIFNYE